MSDVWVFLWTSAVCKMTTFWKFKMFNFTMLMSRFISLVLRSDKRCIIDLENMTRFTDTSSVASLNFIRLLRVVITPSVTSAVQWRHYSFALIHAKNKILFGKPRNIVWKCLHHMEKLLELLFSFRSWFMFNVQTINCISTLSGCNSD